MGTERPSRSGWADAARYTDLGFRFVVACLGGAWGGYVLDQKFALTGRFPLLTILGFFLGLVVGMVSLLRGLGPDERRTGTSEDDGSEESS